MKKILGYLLLLIGIQVSAQTYDASKVSSKAKKVYEEAHAAYRDGDVKKAASLFRKALDIDGN